jgi:uncharacterized protein YndB with AHSA1/START domain
MPAPTTLASRLIPAGPDAVWDALVDPKALVEWLPPGDMTGQMHAFDGREGGGFEMSLYYPDDEPEALGKTAAREDRTRVRFTALEPGLRVVWAVLFDTEDPSLQAEMTITVTLKPAEGGTRVSHAVGEPAAGAEAGGQQGRVPAELGKAGGVAGGVGRR